MAEIITGRAFGSRRGYEPLQEHAYDRYVAQCDANYLAGYADEINIVMRYVAKARDELSVTIRMLRMNGDTGSYGSRGLGDLLAELYRDRDRIQGHVNYYGRLVMHIDERIENAQRFIVECAAH